MTLSQIAVIVEGQSFAMTASGSVIGSIWLRSHLEPRIDFPEAGWTDFPVVILGWWLDQIEGVLRRSSAEATCSFMDGPFEFRITCSGELRLLERRAAGTREVAKLEVSLQAFWQQLNIAASLVVSECDRLGFSNADVVNLRRFIVEKQA